MKKTILLIALLSIFTLTACKKELTACIELDKSTISAGQSITFTSCSENELSYKWKVVGPETAPENSMAWSDKVITIPFSIPGTYSITLDTYSNFSLLGDNANIKETFTVN